MRLSIVSLAFIFLIVFAVGCKEPYVLPAGAIANTNVLVVEGNINVGPDSTIIRLSRSKTLTDTSVTTYETGAQIAVQTDAGASYPLQEIGNGSYGIASIPQGSGADKYRLTITTANNSQYYSDYTPFKKTPLIDSISWEQHSDGVYIYANTHDDQNNTKFYKWDFSETWEYYAPFFSQYEVKNNTIVPRSTADLTFFCWHTIPSSNIVIESTKKLSNDVVYKKKIMFIPTSSEKIGYIYSILVKQYALPEDGYNYWDNLSKNTEQLGSLFDAQPSQITGNIHSKTNASEQVIGFITASSIQQKRIFIYKAQVNNWLYPPGPYSVCDTIHVTTADKMTSVLRGTYVPVDLVTPLGPYYAAPPECVDCRLKGGTTTKPIFWP